MEHRRWYEGKIQELCRGPALQYRARVQHCAQVLFKRFYLRHSVMDYDPQRIFRAAIYVAAKASRPEPGLVSRAAPQPLSAAQVEDCVSDKLEEFCAKVRESAEAVRRHETVVLEGAGFDLLIHTPYRQGS